MASKHGPDEEPVLECAAVNMAKRARLEKFFCSGKVYCLYLQTANKISYIKIEEKKSIKELN